MGQGRGNNNNTATTTGPKQQLHSPRKQKKKGGGGDQDLGRGVGPRKEGVWKNSPFSVNPPPGTPLCTLRFFFFPRRGCFWWFWGVFLGLLAPKLGLLGFLATGLWLLSCLLALLASVCLSWLHTAMQTEIFVTENYVTSKVTSLMPFGIKQHSKLRNPFFT